MKSAVIFRLLFILVILLDCSVLSVHLTSNVYARDVNETNSQSSYHYYKQFIDHNDKSCGTFSQRFLINSTYYKPGGPIFLNTPGEGAIDLKIVEASGVSEIVASFNGLLITIEHRYYGESYPPIKNLNTPNMKYLTVNQALADFAEFIKNPPTDVIECPKDAKWIFVGGSYSGNLATWMRQKFPKLVFAAWASSAPLLSKINFFEYDQGVAHALPCRDRVADAFKNFIDPILLSGNRTEIAALKSQFGLDVLDDDQDFASAISHPISLMVQTYFPPTSPSEIDTIPTFCAAFAQAPDNKSETSALILAQVTKFFLNVSGIITPDAIKANFATSALNTSVVPNDLVSFLYQLQNHQNKGELDPWKSLTVSGSNFRTISRNKVFLIKNGSHVNDLRFPTSVDSDSLKCARNFIRNTLAEWLCVKCATDVSGFIKCQVEEELM
ncbi:25191_t:CDS:2 [Dentiscutata erythropus]|uniref:25191_t:CDS:1 n=1 Tax=Dentiscutata erythropus TaxID=1348616 RepID=A0A9N9H6Q1_9GLOM|nr:25191_t:CDS:2 [Dentiscutata erythropus]